MAYSNVGNGNLVGQSDGQAAPTFFLDVIIGRVVRDMTIFCEIVVDAQEKKEQFILSY